MPWLFLALLLPTTSSAQPAITIFGGAALLVGNNGSGPFALPTDGKVLIPTLGGAIVPKGSRLGLQVEVSLPRDMTKEVPGSIKAGPVVYVVTRRDLIVSGLARVALFTNGRASFNALAGLSVVSNRTDVRCSF
jgi:hypothetical protein